MSDMTSRSDDRDGRARGPRLEAASWVPALVVLVVISLGVAGYAISRPAKAGAATTPAGTITVTGTGTIEGTPNTVQFSIGISTVRPLAVEALNSNNSEVSRLESTFHAEGVPFKDMQTEDVNIYEQTNDHGEFTGFAVNDDLQVTVTNIKKAGKVIDSGASVAGSGINFNGVSFSIANESTLLSSARQRAMQSAMEVANQLLKGTGETVGSIQKVTDQESSQSYPLGIDQRDESFSAYAAPEVPLQAGRQPVSVQVTVTYSLAT